MDLDSPDTWRWIWLAAAVVFAVGEIAVAGSFFLLPFAVGAVAGFISSVLGAPVGAGWLAFVVVSAAGSAVLWPLMGFHRLEDRVREAVAEPPAGQHY